eukprot:TRINITY_DN8370_c0_g2_i1.p1 TRINITY_DN8370_c0_g2~~TRINITY_DN8370_c0_g2_i1.p1  ORF type:complete len:506 (+),score=201.38 TRINITY_DN8370_c0_g2_i1:32-1519(+)
MKRNRSSNKSKSKKIEEEEVVDKEEEEKIQKAIDKVEDFDEDEYFKKKQKTTSGEDEEEKKSEFVKELKEKIAENMKISIESIHYDAVKFIIKFSSSNNEPHTVFLNNNYLKWIAYDDNQNEDGKKNVFDELISSLKEAGELPSDFESIKKNIFPKMQVRVTKTVLRLQERISHKENGTSDPNLGKEERSEIPKLPATSNELPWKPVTEYLGLDLIYDTPTEFLMLKPQDLQRWGKTYEQVWEVAMNNLKEQKIKWKKLSSGVFSLRPGTSYEAPTLLAMAEQLFSLALNGDPVVLPISKSMVVITGSNDKDGLETMLQVATNQASSNDFFSGIMMTYRSEDSKWVEWTVPSDNEFAKDFKYLKLFTLSQWYKHQEEFIVKLGEVEGKIQPFSVDEENFTTGTAWKKGVDCILPETEHVEFEFPSSEKKEEIPNAFVIPSSDEEFHVSFEDVKDIVGKDRWKEMEGFYPKLYYVSKNSYPNDSEIEKLKLKKLDI